MLRIALHESECRVILSLASIVSPTSTVPPTPFEHQAQVFTRDVVTRDDDVEIRHLQMAR